MIRSYENKHVYIYIYIYIYNKKIYFIYYNIQTIFNPLAKLEILYYNFVLFYSQNQYKEYSQHKTMQIFHFVIINFFHDESINGGII